MSGIEINKFAAAFLLACLIACICGLIAEGLYPADESEKRGYKIEGAAEQSEAAAAPVQEKPVDITPFLAKADISRGAQLISQCMTCHTFKKGEPAGVGPNQYGLVGRKVASSPGFNYSDAIQKKGGTWDFQSLSDFITNPQKAVPGTRMAYAGMRKPEDRAALLLYINKNFSDNPLPVPSK